MHLALQCFVIQRKKLEMREVNEKGNPSFFPFPVFCPLVFCCNLCDVIVLVTRVHWDYLARVLSVNCFKSKLKFLKCLQLFHTSMYVAVISRVSVFFSIHQSHILSFIRDIFDFNTSDYSSIESLCDSIVKLAKGRSEQLLRSHSYETDKPQTTSSFDETLTLTSQELQQVGQS